MVRNAAEKIAPECRNAAALAALNVRLRSRRSGTIGSANPIGTLTQKIQCQDSPGQPCR